MVASEPAVPKLPSDYESLRKKGHLLCGGDNVHESALMHVILIASVSERDEGDSKRAISMTGFGVRRAKHPAGYKQLRQLCARPTELITPTPLHGASTLQPQRILEHVIESSADSCSRSALPPSGLVRKAANFVCSISDDRGAEPTYAGAP